ncbi:MAG: aldehyde-activating protein [Rhodospirillaceae bacterium]|nr:aldehyde-activating protein [Rhodospirillaceae bacterium]|tara:strand:- start:989 stop:1480 length:492 start_codon:yes stop_codon:yes gene_type:complete
MTKKIELPLRGGCSCGHVRYELSEKPLFTHACHCVDCQCSTGSAFVIHTLATKSGFKIRGKTNSTTLPTGSGAEYDPHFCSKCGTFVWCQYHIAPKGFVVLRTGTLDKPNNIQPEAHIFTTQKLPWLSLPKDVSCFPAMYNRTETWPKESNQKMDRLILEASK